ncbi:hypothetical protein KKA00_07000, partial [bacterium]|nr:hypothetical protein [bacterium]
EGWTGPGRNSYEFEPGEVGGQPLEEHGIRERSTIPNTYNRLGDFVSDTLAIGEQDFLAVYADTLTEQFWVGTDIVDGPHFPLGIRIAQSSYSWSYNYAQEFILIDYEFENVANNFLKNLYVGLYVDADVGWRGEGTWHEDDVCGFQEYYYYDRKLPDGTVVPDSSIINTAWIADNDGRPDMVTSGSDFTCPAVTGVRVVRAPNPRLRTGFNWWISNGNPDLDFGPAWQDDGSVGDWTQTFGTPNGDARKYFVMSNGEFDYDQTWVADQDYVAENPQIFYNPATGLEEEHNWRVEGNLTNARDIANGYDTRYLLSWGPLGIFDHTDEAGNDIYRLNPGEKFHMTIGYVAGANFHTPQNPQDDVSNNGLVDPTRYNFANLQYNAAWAARVFDNEMVDTNGDGWYGEDIGNDGLYAANIGDPVEYFGHYIGIYPGPDADGSERNGKVDEDGERQFIDGMTYFPEFVSDAPTIQKFGELNIGYMKDNGILDPGDGVPDFKGPPPPPIPELDFETGDYYIQLRWKDNAEDPGYFDPFSQVQDFEGYRIYVSNTGLEYDYELLAEFDQVNFAYYSINDSLATYPDLQTNLPADSTFDDGFTYYRKPVNSNSGLEYIRETDSTYVYRINNAHPGFPRYYAVTSFDFGDPKSGTEPLETARNANAKYVAPSGVPTNEVVVVPNPYRAYEDYTQQYVATSEGSGLSWENQNDGTPQFFPQQDRRIEFMNLPSECLIRIYSVSGDLVAVIPHSSATFNDLGDANNNWVSEYSESWDLNSRNDQQVVSGLYIFSVENLTPEDKGNLQVGKFVIIR